MENLSRRVRYHFDNWMPQSVREVCNRQPITLRTLRASVTVRMPVRIGITLGDCAGIGPEIVDLALRSDRIPKAPNIRLSAKYPDCSLGPADD